jgi:hypothetical protein
MRVLRFRYSLQPKDLPLSQIFQEGTADHGAWGYRGYESGEEKAISPIASFQPVGLFVF